MSDYKFGKNQPPQRRWPIAWYNPMVLLRSLREMVSTGDQIRNLDKREMYPSSLSLIQVAEEVRAGDFWWDFVSDTGDGGNATYAVAREMQKPLLPCRLGDGVEGDIPALLPQGELLVLGGDLAYPGASVEEYQYRLTEMWTAAAPQERPARDQVHQLRPSLAIPQNHDWFDNLSTFSRYFVDTRAPVSAMGIASAENQVEVTPLATRKLQKQSYFAARLPNGWVILGFDFALVGDIDRQQYQAFEQLLASGQITPQDNLILLYPEPYWTRDLGDHAREGYPKRYQRLEALLDQRYRVRLRLAGDIHHYARESASQDGDEPRDLLVTAGGGGAFLHPTHSRIAHSYKVFSREYEAAAMTPDLKQRVRLGIAEPTGNLGERLYDRRHHYPSPAQSRALLSQSWKAFFRPAGNGEGCRTAALLQGNIMFSVLLGGLFMAAALTASWLPALVLMALYAGVSNERSRLLPWVGGALGLGLGGLGKLVPVWLAAYLPSVFPGGLPAYLQVGSFGWHLLLALASFPLGVLLGGLITGFYFRICSGVGLLPNNGFSHLGYEGYKSFLRFRIDSEGNLHAYLWGADHLPEKWQTNTEAAFPVWVEAQGEQLPQWEIKDSFVLRAQR